jgi:hypothetical protein
MTKSEKNFIESHINIPWTVQQLFITEDPDSAICSIANLPFDNINEILNFADIPFFQSLNNDIALAFLPLNSPLLLADLNQMLLQETGYYIASIVLPDVNLKRMGNLKPDIILNSAIHCFKNKVRNIQTNISFQLKPPFSQSLLDDILDEMQGKPFQALSPLKQVQLKHLSSFLSKPQKPKDDQYS